MKMMTLTDFHPARLITGLTILILIVLLQACGTAPTKLPGQREASVEAAEQAEEKGEYILAAREYAELVKTASAKNKTGYQLRYSEALIRAGQIKDASRSLNEINISRFDKSARAHRYVLLAMIDSYEGNYSRAIHLLNKANAIRNLSPALNSKIRQVMSETELALNNPIGAAKNLIIAERYIVDPEGIDYNQLKIWEILNNIKPSDLQRELNLARKPVLRGWLELAIANAKGRKQLKKTIKKWPETHPAHPATKTLLATLTGARFKQIGYISRAAVLLPLSSERYGVAAQAVKEGMRIMDNADKRPDKPFIRVYDIGDNPDEVEKFYAQAVIDGAQLVIGPLGKEAINKIVDSGDMDVPTLLLGNTDESIDANSAVFQFGLSPEEEAKLAAERAYLDGHRTVSILYSETVRGTRLLNAFSDHWLKLGGIVLSTAAYELYQQDYREPVKQLLNITDSEARKQALAAIIKKPIRFRARRRQDIDSIFLIADAKHGRLIKPQLNYHGASRLPVYSTSDIFTGRRDYIKDADLDGIRFGDMPWMLIEDGDIYQLRMRQGNWPYARTQLDRLYALGMDAYSIIPYLSRISSDTSLRFSGVTSSLSVGSDGELRRALLWARFSRGVPKLLDKFYKYTGQVN
ncbi:MAG: penicillin-binding protein activator [Gammaproteobacteria bacterium]|nr:MAG: penicillin-binding protein activator [Gammaproteobacteria bacterium]